MYGNPNQVFEYYSDSDAITATAAAPVTGGTFVKLAAGGAAQMPKVSTADAAGAAYGVAAYDAAAGEQVTILRKGVLGITAGAAVTPGPVEVGAGGKAVPRTAGIIVGYAHADAATNNDAAVALSV